MNTLRVIALLLLAHPVVAQVYCVRAIGHTPFYERIFIAKGNLLRPSTLRGVDDLGPLARYPETNRIDRLFTESGRERTNGLYVSCLSEAPLSAVALRAPGGLILWSRCARCCATQWLSHEAVGRIISDTVVGTDMYCRWSIPRAETSSLICGRAAVPLYSSLIRHFVASCPKVTRV